MTIVAGKSVQPRNTALMQMAAVSRNSRRKSPRSSPRVRRRRGPASAPMPKQRTGSVTSRDWAVVPNPSLPRTGVCSPRRVAG